MAISPIPDVTAFRKLWQAWEPLDEDEKAQADRLEKNLEGLAVSEEPTLAQRVHNLERLDIYRDIVNLYASDSEDKDKDRFKKLRRELDAPAMRQFNLVLRIKRATEGKDAANKKYKDGNWLGALYTYTVAWGCLVPYYAAAIENDKVKTDYQKLESQLFSNITAMIVTGLASKKELKTADQRKKLLEIGLRTCVLIRGMADVVTAGVMEKTCRRATDIHKEYTTKHKSEPTPLTPPDLAWFTNQCTALKGVEGTRAYKDLPNVNKVRLPVGVKAGEQLASTACPKA